MNLFGQFHLRHLRSFLSHAKNVEEINVPTRKKTLQSGQSRALVSLVQLYGYSQWLLPEAAPPVIENSSVCQCCNSELKFSISGTITASEK